MRPLQLGIRARLTLLTLALLTPMVAIAAWHFSEERADSRSHITERSTEVARLIASRAGEYVRRTEGTLDAVAVLARVDPPDIRYNDSVLTVLDERVVGGVGTLNVQGVGKGNIGSSAANLKALRSYSLDDRRYYAEALRSGKFAIGEPVRSRPDSTKWMMGFGLPIRGRNGAFVAVAFATYFLDSLRYMADVGTLPRGSVVTVIDNGGRVVFRSTGSETLVGRDVSTFDGFREMASTPRGTTSGVSPIDGVDRIRA